MLLPVVHGNRGASAGRAYELGGVCPAVAVTESPVDLAVTAIDGALARALLAPELRGVYLSPWWPLGPIEGAGAAAGFKRSILRREPGRGAVHWGHLYLLVRDGARLVVPPAVGTGSVSAESRPIEVALPPALAGGRSLWIRPRVRAPCEEFAHHLAAELARPVPETS
jgi:hypothetical protein